MEGASEFAPPPSRLVSWMRATAGGPVQDAFMSHPLTTASTASLQHGTCFCYSWYHIWALTVCSAMQWSFFNMQVISTHVCVHPRDGEAAGSYSTAQHSTAQHSAAQRSTKLLLLPARTNCQVCVKVCLRHAHGHIAPFLLSNRQRHARQYCLMLV